MESTWIEEFGELDASDAVSVKDEFVKKVKKQNLFYPTAQQKFKEFLVYFEDSFISLTLSEIW